MLAVRISSEMTADQPASAHRPYGVARSAKNARKWAENGPVRKLGTQAPISDRRYQAPATSDAGSAAPGRQPFLMPAPRGMHVFAVEGLSSRHANAIPVQDPDSGGV
jgi:hypothetical protein